MRRPLPVRTNLGYDNFSFLLIPYNNSKYILNCRNFREAYVTKKSVDFVFVCGGPGTTVPGIHP
jgi:hypothetical protein